MVRGLYNFSVLPRPLAKTNTQSVLAELGQATAVTPLQVFPSTPPSSADDEVLASEDRRLRLVEGE